jgi:hypothetical protein
MTSSKFFTTALIATVGVFSSTAAFAMDHGNPKPDPKPTTCDCATSTSLIQYGKDNLVTSVATGAGSAATFASVETKGGLNNITAQTGGAATSNDKRDVKVGNGTVYATVD